MTYRYGFGAAQGLFPDEGPSVAEVRASRRAHEEDEDSRTAFAREEAARWAETLRQRTLAALRNVAEQRGDIVETYRALYQAAESSLLSPSLRAEAAEALQVVAPILAGVLRRSGYYFDESLGQWVPQSYREALEAERGVLPRVEELPPIYGYLLEHRHPALRGRRR